MTPADMARLSHEAQKKKHGEEAWKERLRSIAKLPRKRKKPLK